MSTYRLLVVHPKTDWPTELTSALEASGHQIDTLELPHAIKERVETIKPDAVIIFCSSPDTHLFKQIEMLENDHPCPVIVFTSDGRSEKIQSAMRAGVASYVVDGFSLERLKPVIETAVSRYRETQSLKRELQTAKTDLAERKLIDRAKGLIMDQRKCAESEAYKMLRKMAMDRKKRLAEIAQDVLSVGEVFKS